MVSWIDRSRDRAIDRDLDPDRAIDRDLDLRIQFVGGILDHDLADFPLFVPDSRTKILFTILGR